MEPTQLNDEMVNVLSATLQEKHGFATVSQLDKALTEFWAWMRGRAATTARPPGGRSALDLGDAWRGKAKAAYWRATLADHHLKEHRLVEAAVEWRQALGLSFPVPGERPLKVLPLFKKAAPAP